LPAASRSTPPGFEPERLNEKVVSRRDIAINQHRDQPFKERHVGFSISGFLTKRLGFWLMAHRLDVVAIQADNEHSVVTAGRIADRPLQPIVKPLAT